MEKVYFSNQKLPIYETGLCEADFVNNTIVNYKKISGNYDTEFYIINGYESQGVDVSKLNKNFIVFIFDERKGKYSKVVEKAGAVFQAYISDDELIGDNHYCFPLGYNKLPNYRNIKNIIERKVNVFFIGNFHSGRHKFYSWLSNIRLPFAIQVRLQKILKLNFDKKFPNSYIRFTSQFNTGLSSSEYNEMLSESKIILCPGGSVSVESFRLYEAMIQGCIVVTERLPNRSYFKDMPVVQLDNWNNADSVINEILQNNAKLSSMSEASMEWYRKSASPEAMGKYLNNKFSSPPNL